MTITHYQNWLRPHHRHFFVNDQDANSWTPRVDVREEDTRYVILADIPGVDSKDIEISMDKSVLTIKGERKSETIAEKAQVGDDRRERESDTRRAPPRCLRAQLCAAGQRRCGRDHGQRQERRSRDRDPEEGAGGAAQDRGELSFSKPRC